MYRRSFQKGIDRIIKKSCSFSVGFATIKCENIVQPQTVFFSLKWGNNIEEELPKPVSKTIGSLNRNCHITNKEFDIHVGLQLRSVGNP